MTKRISARPIGARIGERQILGGVHQQPRNGTAHLTAIPLKPQRGQWHFGTNSERIVFPGSTAPRSTWPRTMPRSTRPATHQDRGTSTLFSNIA
ncbi:hypothetical protein ACQP1G_14095 [Nocardia sp. CA-107356]|uniref:hypothetical protein n=1 Tax=Nocardia sp. CA-107356 TaxID=3239972 RepID=UPI003D907AF3